MAERNLFQRQNGGENEHPGITKYRARTITEIIERNDRRKKRQLCKSSAALARRLRLNAGISKTLKGATGRRM